MGQGHSAWSEEGEEMDIVVILLIGGALVSFGLAVIGNTRLPWVPLGLFLITLWFLLYALGVIPGT